MLKNFNVIADPGNQKKILKSLNKLWRNLKYSEKPPKRSITIESYIKHEAEEEIAYRQINPEHYIYRKLPKNLGANFSECFEYHLSCLSPATFVSSIPYGRIYGNGIAITPENFILTDLSLTFDDQDKDHWLCKSGNLQTPKIYDKNVALLSSHGAETYFHWLHDVVPRLQIVDKEEIDLFYVNYEKKFQIEYLNLLNIPHEKIIPAKKNSYIKAKNLTAPPLPGLTGNPTKSSCDFLKRLTSIMPSLQNNQTQKNKNRIYISRKAANSRKIVNEDELVYALKKFGFEMCQLEHLSIQSQIELFAQSECVMGLHGSGLSNLVYCSPNTRVVEIFSPKYMNLCFWKLAEMCDIEYFYYVGEPDPRSPGRLRNVIVNVELLINSLQDYF